MKSRAWWGFFTVFIVAIALSLFFFWRWRSGQINERAETLKPSAPKTEEATTETETIPRDSASLSPVQEYRKALEADDARRVPTWEEMNRDRPAEF